MGIQVCYEKVMRNKVSEEARQGIFALFEAEQKMKAKAEEMGVDYDVLRQVEEVKLRKAHSLRPNKQRVMKQLDRSFNLISKVGQTVELNEAQLAVIEPTEKREETAE